MVHLICIQKYKNSLKSYVVKYFLYTVHTHTSHSYYKLKFRICNALYDIAIIHIFILTMMLNIIEKRKTLMCNCCNIFHQVICNSNSA